MGWQSRAATQTGGLVQKFHKGIYYVHIFLHVISNNLQFSSMKEGFKSFIREAGEKPPREVGKRVRVRTYMPN